MKLPVDFDITSLDCTTKESELVLMAQNRALVRGYNHFVVPRDVLARAERRDV